MTPKQDTYWFALKIFKGMAAAKKEFSEAGIRTFVPFLVEESLRNGVKYKEKPLMASLIFLKPTPKYVKEYWVKHIPGVLYYREFESGEPAAIPDDEMEAFIRLTSPADPGTALFENDSPEFHKGQKVKITGGKFEGYVGNIYRIGRDRKVVVKVSDNFSFRLDIHPRYLKPIE